jgi:hypothetical protein
MTGLTHTTTVAGSDVRMVAERITSDVAAAPGEYLAVH